MGPSIANVYLTSLKIMMRSGHRFVFSFICLAFLWSCIVGLFHLADNFSISVAAFYLVFLPIFLMLTVIAAYIFNIWVGLAFYHDTNLVTVYSAETLNRAVPNAIKMLGVLFLALAILGGAIIVLLFATIFGLEDKVSHLLGPVLVTLSFAVCFGGLFSFAGKSFAETALGIEAIGNKQFAVFDFAVLSTIIMLVTVIPSLYYELTDTKVETTLVYAAFYIFAFLWTGSALGLWFRSYMGDAYEELKEAQEANDSPASEIVFQSENGLIIRSDAGNNHAVLTIDAFKGVAGDDIGGLQEPQYGKRKRKVKN